MLAPFISSDILKMREDLLHSTWDSWELQDSGSEFSVMGDIWCLEEPGQAVAVGFWTIIRCWRRNYINKVNSYQYILRLCAASWEPPGHSAFEIGEETAWVHLRREGERHGVGGDHGGGHGEHPRILGQGVRLAPRYQGVGHGVGAWLVKAPVRPLILGLAGYERGHLQWFIGVFYCRYLLVIDHIMLSCLTCLRAATCDRCLFTTVVIFSDVLSSHDSLSSFGVITSSITLQPPENDRSK